MFEPRTMLDKIWSEHVIVPRPGSEELLFVDWNLVHEGRTFLAFDQLCDLDPRSLPASWTREVLHRSTPLQISNLEPAPY